MFAKSLVVCGLTFLVMACSKKGETRRYSEDEVKAITDSALAVKQKQLAKEAAKDLEIRKVIELKARMDSMQSTPIKGS